MSEIKTKMEVFLEVNEGEYTIYLNIWNIMKDIIKSKFIALNTNIKNGENS